MTNNKQENEEFVGAEELADAATEILRTAEWFQAERVKGSVGAYPNARQIRFYEQQKLMEPPIERRRNAPVYRYKDLLILLAIKKLQETKRLPINVIKTLVADKTIEALEKLLAEEIQIFRDKSALDKYRQSIGHTDDSDVVVVDNSTDHYGILEDAGEKNAAESFLKTLIPKPKIGHEEDRQILYSRSLPLTGGPSVQATAETWTRYQIAPGLELHIESRFRLPKDEAERQQTLGIIEQILRRK
ncbi:MAG: MerR family transcriptional regulator [Pyrinomonadaceae bacterium]